MRPAAAAAATPSSAGADQTGNRPGCGAWPPGDVEQARLWSARAGVVMAGSGGLASPASPGFFFIKPKKSIAGEQGNGLPAVCPYHWRKEHSRTTCSPVIDIRFANGSQFPISAPFGRVRPADGGAEPPAKKGIWSEIRMGLEARASNGCAWF